MGRRRRAAPSLRPLEKDIQQAVFDHWRLLGKPHTLMACVPNQYAHGQPGLTPGIPDLIVAGPDVPGKVGFIELKCDKLSHRTPAQWAFAQLCQHLGIAYGVTFGRDEPILLLERWGLVRMSAPRILASG